MNILNRKNLLPALLIAVAVTLSYASTIAKPFIWDDLPFILYEEAHRELSNIPSFFTQGQHMLYRPLRSTAYALTYALFEYNSIAYRLIAIAFHIAVSLLFVVVARRLGLSRSVSIIAGLAFGLHPIHADRVANTTASFDLLGLIFGFAAFVTWLNYRNLGGRKRLVASGLLLFLGLLGSEECATIPLLIAGWIWVDDGRFRQSRDRSALLTTFSILAMYLVIRTVVLGQVARVGLDPAHPFAARMFTMTNVVWHQMAKGVFPFSLRPAYYVDINTSPWSLTVLFGSAALIAAAAYLLKQRGSKSLFAFGLAWFFIALAPFSNIIPGDTFMAERYLYSPLAGLILMACAVLERSGLLASEGSSRQTLAKALAATCLFLMAVFTFNRGYIWSDELRLWGDAYQKDDRAALILSNLGNQIKRRSIPKDTCPLFDRSIHFNPDHVESLVGAGECAARRGEHDKAMELFSRSRQLNPNHAGPLEGLAQLYVLRGEMDEADKAARRLLAIEPDSLVAHYVLGYIYFDAGDTKKASAQFSRVIASKNPRRDIVESAMKFLGLIERQVDP